MKVSKGEDEHEMQHDGSPTEDMKRDENKQQHEEEEIKEPAVTIDYSSFKSVRKGDNPAVLLFATLFIYKNVDSNFM